MIVYEEKYITSLLFRGLAHARLTEASFTLSLVLMRWVVLCIPLSSITEAHFYKDLLGREIAVSYYNREGLFKGLRFSPRSAKRWQDAFHQVGIRITTEA
jgi:hypothetical protein